MIDNLEEEYLNFGNAYMIYSEAKWNKNKIIRKFKSLCKKNQNILKDKIDLLVTIFEAAEPEFCKTYKSLRSGAKKVSGTAKIKKSKNTAEKVVKEKVVKTDKIDVKKEQTLAEIKEITETKIVEKKKAPVLKKTNTSSGAKSQTTKTSGATKVTKAPTKRRTTTSRKKTAPKTTEQVDEIVKS
jgi:hypothetical protein